MSEWIDAKELPEEGKWVLVWYEYFRWGNYNRMYQTYGIGQQNRGYWSVDEGGMKARVLAWQPLPEPPKKRRAGKKMDEEIKKCKNCVFYMHMTYEDIYVCVNTIGARWGEATSPEFCCEDWEIDRSTVPEY